MTYSIHLLYANGRGSYLTVKGRCLWKTRRIAISHAHNIAQLKTRAGIMAGLVAVEVEDQWFDTVKTFEVPS